MKNVRSVRDQVSRALAFAHAALDEATPRFVTAAKRYAEEVLPRVGRMKPKALPLSEAHEVMLLVGQLRAVLTLLDRQLQLQPRLLAN